VVRRGFGGRMGKEGGEGGTNSQHLGSERC
jgi:hypothetical protein